jgi:hypothetical protein
MEPMTPKWTPILGITFVRESWMFKALVEKAKNHQIGPPKDTIGKVLKFKCPFIIHLDLKCMSYDQKKGQ